MGIKPDSKFKENVWLIIIGVLFFAFVTNLSKVGSTVNILFGFFMPLIIGSGIAFIVNVPMHFFERQIEKLENNKNRKVLEAIKIPLCLIVTLVLIGLAIYFIGDVIFPNLISSVSSLIDEIQKLSPTWIEILQKYGINTDFLSKYAINLDADKIIDVIKEGSLNLISTAGKAATSVFDTVTNVFFGFVFAIYILVSKKKLGRQSKQLAYAYLRKDIADDACEIASLTYKTFASFLSGQCLEATILGLMFFAVLTIGGFPYAGTIAVIIGALSLIPWIGAFIGLFFGIAMIAVVSVQKMVAFIIVFFVVQQIEGHIVYPKVVGGSIGLPAIWTLFAVIVGGNLFGIFGMVIFIPLVSVLYELIRRDTFKRLAKKKITIEK
jgi:predicted PurR-regulated permease PerM